MPALYRCIAGRQTSASHALRTHRAHRTADDGAGQKNLKVPAAASNATGGLWSPGSSNSACHSWLPGKYRGRLEKHLLDTAEKAGIPASVVNARQVKNVPGRKTDSGDSEWLAPLGRFGLVKPSFIPPADLRELRIVSRSRQKVAPILAGEANRLPKVRD